MYPYRLWPPLALRPNTSRVPKPLPLPLSRRESAGLSGPFPEFKPHPSDRSSGTRPTAIEHQQLVAGLVVEDVRRPQPCAQATAGSMPSVMGYWVATRKSRSAAGRDGCRRWPFSRSLSVSHQARAISARWPVPLSNGNRCPLRCAALAPDSRAPARIRIRDGPATRRAAGSSLGPRHRRNRPPPTTSPS